MSNGISLKIDCTLPVNDLPFNQMDIVSARKVYYNTGQWACYQDVNLVIINIMVIIDQALDITPDGFEVPTGEVRYTVAMLKEDVAMPLRGEIVQTASQTLQLDDQIGDDLAEWTFTAKVVE